MDFASGVLINVSWKNGADFSRTAVPQSLECHKSLLARKVVLPVKHALTGAETGQ